MPNSGNILASCLLIAFGAHGCLPSFSPSYYTDYHKEPEEVISTSTRDPYYDIYFPIDPDFPDEYNDPYSRRKRSAAETDDDESSLIDPLSIINPEEEEGNPRFQRTILNKTEGSNQTVSIKEANPGYFELKLRFEHPELFTTPAKANGTAGGSTPAPAAPPPA